MPEKWDVVLELKLMLTVIEIIDAKPPSWDEVSEKMGPGYTSEACRQHFQKLKRGFSKTDPTSIPTVAPTKAGVVTKSPKTTRSASNSVTKSATKSAAKSNTGSATRTKAAGMKRKRADSVDESDRESKKKVNATADVDDKGDTVDEETKAAEALLKYLAAAIIKSEEQLEDGSLDISHDSLYE